MWISKKKFESLMFEFDAAKERAKFWENKYSNDKIELRRNATSNVTHRLELYKSRYEKQCEENATLTEKYEALKAEVDNYKKCYLDELQKRLELADRVRGLEGK